MNCKAMKFKLPSGSSIPAISFGTFRIRSSKSIEDVLDVALSVGYRSIDTAAVYGNEQDIGTALKILLPKYNLKREDIFITTKLSPSHHGDEAFSALKTSLRNLGCNYVDLYLIHWPGRASVSMKDAENLNMRTRTWEQLVKAKKEGLARNIGVSNYTVRHLEQLLSNSFGEIPALNQVEWHPHYYQSELLNYCQKYGIVLQAYSSLGGTNNKKLVSDENIIAISKKLNKTPAQVLLRWALQQNIAIIPKACSKKHIEENIDLDFVIPKMDVMLLNNLNVKCKYAWDPTEVL